MQVSARLIADASAIHKGGKARCKSEFFSFKKKKLKFIKQER